MTLSTPNAAAAATVQTSLSFEGAGNHFRNAGLLLVCIHIAGLAFFHATGRTWAGAFMTATSILGSLALILCFLLAVSAAIAATNPSFSVFGNRARAALVVSLPAETAVAILQGAIGESAARVSELELRLSGRMSLSSFGEEITLRAFPIETGACTVMVDSRSKVRTTLFDWGANARNVRQLMDRVKGSLLTAAALQSQRLAAERARHQRTEAKLARLQAQVEAHFLFNTLAHLGVLIERDAPAARAMLDSLVRHLRSSSRMLMATETTLGEEVDLVRGYLEVMRHRLGTRLAFVIDVPESMVGVTCLPGTLLPLVENAVKHGVEPSREGGRIDIRCVTTGGTVRLAVADNGVGFISSSGTGTGLANLKERLREQYGEEARVDLHRGASSGVVATVVFPLPGPPAA